MRVSDGTFSAASRDGPCSKSDRSSRGRFRDNGERGASPRRAPRRPRRNASSLLSVKRPRALMNVRTVPGGWLLGCGVGEQVSSVTPQYVIPHPLRKNTSESPSATKTVTPHHPRLCSSLLKSVARRNLPAERGSPRGARFATTRAEGFSKASQAFLATNSRSGAAPRRACRIYPSPLRPSR